MNTIELKAYILSHVEDAKDVDITLNEDDSFYVKVKYDLRSCGALFLPTGYMYPMAGVSFDFFESELMDEVKDAVSRFIILKKRSSEVN